MAFTFPSWSLGTRLRGKQGIVWQVELTEYPLKPNVPDCHNAYLLLMQKRGMPIPNVIVTKNTQTGKYSANIGQ